LTKIEWTRGKKSLGPNHLSLSTILENMAALYKKCAKEEEAESLEKRAAAIRAIKQ
jgi:hypothetical protein